MDRLSGHLPNLTSPQQLTASSNVLSKAKTLAAYHAKLILGCYRAGEANDPEIYTTAVAAVLSRYPSDVGARLSDPKDGIPGKIKWLPSVSEIRTACDEIVAADVAAAKRAADLAEQWRLREEFEQRLDCEPTGPVISNFDDARRPTGPFEKPGDDWNRHRAPLIRKTIDEWKRFTDDELRAIYAPKEPTQP